MQIVPFRSRSASNGMKRWEIIVLVLVILFFGFSFSQDILARLVWQKYGRADIALALVRRDAGLAMQLGNYYFNGTIGKSEYNLEKAERAYKKAVAINSKILWGHYQLARIYFVSPVRSLARAIGASPKDLGEATSNGVKGNYDAAVDEINKELEANPENLRSLYVRGLIYGYRNQFGDLELAENDFRRFTYWAPSEWAGYNDLAWILSKAGKYRGAKEAIQNAFANAPNASNNPWLWNSQGVAELNLGEYKNAQKSFERAMELAGKLTPEDWRKSYPGNDPASADSGLDQFKTALEKNLERAKTLGAI